MKTPLVTTHPDIAAQLVDPTLATTLSRGSSKKVDWQCPLGHIWSAAPNTRTSMGSGCPVCAGKVVLPGFNDLASQAPEIAAQLVDSSIATKVTPNSGKRYEWRCPEDHTWTASVHTRNSGHGCPVCAGKVVVRGSNDLATTHPTIAAQLDDPADGCRVTAFSAKKLSWRCSANHVWTAPVSRIANGASCPFCSGLRPSPGQTDLATTHPDLATQLVDPTIATTLKAGTNRKVAWRCTHGHEWWASPNARTSRSRNGCPVCSNRVVIPGINDLATTHPKLAAQALDDVSRISYGNRSLITWKCEKEHTWQAQPNWRTTSGSGCPTCAASVFVSQGEKELAEVIRALVPGMIVRTTVRDLVKGFELDIVVDDLRLAFEFNGLWWHSEAHLNNNYHANKSRAVEEAGYRLVHVWADTWDDRRDIVIRGVAHRLGATSRLLDVLPDAEPKAAEKVFARKLTIGGATSSEARRFWETNHLQGPVGSNRYFSLRDTDDEIRALLGIGPTNHGSRVAALPGVWDIQRYATLGSVPGGFTRLLKHATSSLRATGENITTWTSYSNDDVSEGGMYLAAGFIADKHQAPSYTYIGNLTGWKRAHRTRFVRQRFVDDPSLAYEPGWTEHQAALANKLYRVYDAGKTRWSKTV